MPGPKRLTKLRISSVQEYLKNSLYRKSLLRYLKGIVSGIPFHRLVDSQLATSSLRSSKFFPIRFRNITSFHRLDNRGITSTRNACPYRFDYPTYRYTYYFIPPVHLRYIHRERIYVDAYRYALVL